MPLSPPKPRELLHTRNVQCRGYERADGLWDIEGHIVDTKTYAFESSWRGQVTPGTPVHEMWIRLTIDDRMVIREVETTTDAGPFRVCPDITPNFKRLEGERIGPGFTRRVRELVGGRNGCTHIVEMLGQVATTGFQTLVRKRVRDEQAAKQARAARAEPQPGDAPPAPRKKPMIIDTCHALSSEGEIVKNEWPEFYTGR
ncbi:MAG: DUF2889 domain-containing protein [Alphaproteobacteria bacterium]